MSQSGLLMELDVISLRMMGEWTSSRSSKMDTLAPQIPDIDHRNEFEPRTQRFEILTQRRAQAVAFALTF